MVWSLIMAARSGCSAMVLYGACSAIREFGSARSSSNWNHGTLLAGSAPVARPDPLVSPVGFL